MRYVDIANVPEDEGHRPIRTSVALFNIVPRITVPKDASGATPVDVDSIPGNHKPSMVVLEGDWIRAIPPVI